jgi:hypothetical protein
VLRDSTDTSVPASSAHLPVGLVRFDRLNKLCSEWIIGKPLM